MNIVFIIFAVILGLLVGSFLNVVALRFNTGKSLGGRSGCFSCGSLLTWKQLIPAFSWLFQKGRCHSCGSHISASYILGEITTAIFFGLVAGRGLLTGVDLLSLEYLISTGFLFIIFSLLLVILFYDIRHKIIPDSLSFSFGLLAFLGLFFFDISALGFMYSGFHIPSWEFITAGILIPLPFAFLWLISKGKWLGLGDPKLMVGMGFFFGIAQGFSSIFLSFWIGTLFVVAIGVINLIFKKRLFRDGKKSIMKEELPFAPFLIISFLVTLVFNINFFSLIL
jgi:prepilin signal peptidase PulO-like enzyme (type II secretory pathway)